MNRGRRVKGRNIPKKVKNRVVKKGIEKEIERGERKKEVIVGKKIFRFESLVGSLVVLVSLKR